MRAARLAAPATVDVETVELPEPGAGEVRIRLEGCGVCGSSLPVFEGRPWFEYPAPAGAPGHEGWGIVDAAGPDVIGLALGQRVAALSYRAFADFDVARADGVVPLPAELGDAPFPGEAIGCAMNAFRRSCIGAGDTVAIIGIGFLGAILTSLAARAGATVIAISRRPFALDIARTQGASAALSLESTDEVIHTVERTTGGAGADCVIEATGQQVPLDLASRLVRIRGRLVIAGYHQDGPRQVDMQLWNWRGIDVVNAHERDPSIAVAGIRDAIRAQLDGSLELGALYTHRFELGRTGEALDMMRQRPDGFLKALVIP